MKTRTKSPKVEPASADRLIAATRARVAEFCQRVQRDRDLPSLIAWAHAASETGVWLAQNLSEKTGAEAPETVEGRSPVHSLRSDTTTRTMQPWFRFTSLQRRRPRTP